jgi:hypothetical protein
VGQRQCAVEDVVSAAASGFDSSPPRCRICDTLLGETFADLGMTPLANSFIRPGEADLAEPFYPLHALVCPECHLVQLAAFAAPAEIFSTYLYFSSFSDSWLRHAEAYARRTIERFRLGPQTEVVEIASNDGYLLQYFKRAGVPVLGVDPAANVAAAAIERGIPTEVAFFGAATASRLRASGHAPMLMAANNVLAHVPDLHDFVEGFRILLAASGVATFEFPHLLRLVQENQFDTIYHEHFSYLSLAVVERLFAGHGLVVFDVEELPTHGGSLRIYARHAANAQPAPTAAVAALRAAERAAALDNMETYHHFADRVVDTKCALLEFLIGARRRGEHVVGYGAPAKGNTLLNYCGIGTELLRFTVDRNPHKQGLLLPGSRIPIRDPEAILQSQPEYVLILPWNLREEIAAQLAAMRGWGGRFVVPIPDVTVF